MKTPAKHLSVAELIASIDEDASEPAVWINSAACLFYSSEVLERHREFAGKPESLKPVSSRQVERMLDGFAFENLIKAVAVKRGKVLYTGGRMKTDLPKPHDLVAHAKWAGLTLTESEASYLAALSDVMVGAGRYPFRRNESKRLGGSVWMLRRFAAAKAGLLTRIRDELQG